MDEYLLITVNDLNFGIPVKHIDHVVRMVLMTPVLAAPKEIAGTINYHGEILPVLSLRNRFSLPERDHLLEDKLVIIKAGIRKVAIIADHVIGTSSISKNTVTAEEIIPGLSGIQGIVRTGEGLILIKDPARFLSLDEKYSMDKMNGPEENKHEINEPS